MKKYLSIWVVLPFMLFIWPSSLVAQFYSLETKNLRLIYYGKTHEYLVKHVARCFENALEFHEQLFGYTPSEKITVLLHDFSDYGNAGAGALPRNHVTVSIAPYNYIFETMPANERMNSTMNHELVHVLANDMASSRDRLFRTLFLGKVRSNSQDPITMLYSFLTVPRRAAPRWYHEGIAVFMETWMAGGLGRALGAYDEMVFRTLVHENREIFDLLGLESAGTRIDFQVGVNSYLYGTRFMSYLALQYGPKTLIQWVSRPNQSSSYFASQFRKTFHHSLNQIWKDWIEWEVGFQRNNLAAIQKNPITPFRPIARRALGSVSRAFYDSTTHKLYAGVNYQGQVPHIAAIDLRTGDTEKIHEVKGAILYSVTSLAYDDSSRTLFFTTDNNQWRDLNALNPRTKNSRLLMKDVRIGDLAVNPADHSLWGVKHLFGISTIVRIPPPYTDWKQIVSLPYGQDIYDMDISPDGTQVIATMVEVSGKQTLVRVSMQQLTQGTFAPERIIDLEPSIPSNFVFSPDGKYLFGSSYYSGVSNIYRYDLEKEDLQILSNCLTGFFRPVPISQDSILVFRYTSDGFLPVMIPNQPIENVAAIRFMGNEVVKKYPVLKDWLAGSPGRINIDSLTLSYGKYHSISSMRLASAYPVVEGYKDYTAVGWRLNFSDPVGFHNGNLIASYIPNARLPEKERWHLAASFDYRNWQVFFNYNRADFYDLFGPTKTSRKGYSLTIQYQKTLIYDRPKTMDYVISAAGYGGLKRLPEYQNIRTSFDRFFTLWGRFRYQYMRASLGAVDYEKGLKWEFSSSNYYVIHTLYPHIFTTFDLGIPLFIPHSSIWLRSSAGYSIGRREEPFANFYFGGFGNNWVDSQSEKRYREYASFPGVELNAVAGTNFGKLLVEWNLPPLRFRRLGLPILYSPWARISFFSSGIITNLDSRPNQRKMFNLGSQIDFRLIFLSHLKMTFSLGYAAAFEHNRSVTREFMISFKIL